MSKDKLPPFDKQESFRIINIQAADIYYANVYLNKDVEVKNNKDSFNGLFSNLMPLNLDLIYLNEKGKFKYQALEGECFSYDIIDVSFKYTLKLDEKGNQVFKSKETFKEESTLLLREHLYKNGFYLNKHHYVRYKRASGSARSGNCLFIKENLFNLLNKWSKLDLNEKSKKCTNNLTSYEAYRALSLSSLVKTFKLNPYNILFVKDANVTLKNEKVIKVIYKEGEGLDAVESVEDINNNIFDGEGLLDKEIFIKAGYTKKGMMLLRNRFFKCCAFNTNLQKWFRDNNITDVKQLYGFTFATDIKDIKLVVSESCLKYVKLCKDGFTKENIKKWCDNISDDKNESIFGVVKTDKPTRFFKGRMVETTYQLINSLQLPYSQMFSLISPYVEYINYIRDIKNTPAFIRYFLEGETSSSSLDDYYIDESEDLDIDDIAESILDYSSYTFKNRICLDLIKIDGNIKDTGMFKNRVFDSIVDSLKLKLYNGRVLVNGTYSTLFGNPYEYLKYIILDEKGKPQFDIDKPVSLFNKDELYCSFFKDGAEIVGSRAPHVSMGNVLMAKNVKKDAISKYFNLSKNIVIVDAISNNIQYRLSGCDYDSDTMLMSDNPILVKAAKKNYKKFLVPYSAYKPLEKSPIDKEKSVIDKVFEIDKSIARNYVGSIVNLSQLLNSHFWNQYNNDKKNFNIELYKKICILSCLAGSEIDRSKRMFPFDTHEEYNRIRKYAEENNFLKEKPLFFKNISNEEGERLSINDIEEGFNEGKQFKTAMDELWAAIFSAKFVDTRTKPITFFSFINKGFKTAQFTTDDYRQMDACKVELTKINDMFSLKYGKKDKRKKFEVEKKNFLIQVKRCYRKIKHRIRTVDRAKLLIDRLEKEKNGYSNLFLLLYIITYFGEDLGYSLSSLFPGNSKPLPTLVETTEDKKQFTLFNQYYYRLKEEGPIDRLISSIFS